MARTVTPGGNCTGVGLRTGDATVEPTPRWPAELSPQAQTDPSLRTARQLTGPAAMAMTSFRFFTWTGAVNCAGVADPVPIWPDELSPQAQTLPSLPKARLKLAPAAIAATS